MSTLDEFSCDPTARTHKLRVAAKARKVPTTRMHGFWKGGRAPNAPFSGVLGVGRGRQSFSSWSFGCWSGIIGGGDEVSRKAAGVGQLMLLGIDRKSETDDEPEDDEGDDEVEKARVLLFAFHRNPHKRGPLIAVAIGRRVARID